MASIVDQIKELTAKRQVLIDQLISSLRAEVEALNDLGYSYELVEGGIAPAKAQRRPRKDAGAVRWAASITRSITYAKANKLTKSQALDGVTLALEKLANRKGLSVPGDVLAQAEQQVTESIKGK